MTLYEFKLLNEDEQASMLWDIGVFLIERQDQIFRYVLYQIDGFYVEVWYHKDLNAIQSLKSFSSTRQLEPYLSKIKINMLPD